MPFSFQSIIPTGFDKRLKRILLIHRHKPASGCIIIPMVSDIGSFDFAGLLGSIPPEVSMFDILGSPVIGDIISLIMENIATLPEFMGDPTNILSLLLSTFMPIIVNGVKNLIILIVCIFIGGFIGRLIKKPEDS